jgi:hypothetical protein
MMPIVGFRYWMWEGGWLKSPHFYAVWRDHRQSVRAVGVTTAGGPTGIYAFYDDRRAGPTRGDRLDRSLSSRHYIVGAIVAWGTVELHEYGFRAQHAKVVGLVDDGLARRATGWWSRMGWAELPVLPPDELRQYAQWFGELRGPLAAALPGTEKP